MYVYEEIIEGKKLTEIINETHVNVKYLPGHPLPPNVVSIKLFMVVAKLFTSQFGIKRVLKLFNSVVPIFSVYCISSFSCR